MEYFFKTLIYILCRYEKSKGSSNMYALISSVSTISFLILINVHSALLFAEYFISGIFLEINNWLYNENHLVLTIILLFFIPFVWLQLRRSSYEYFSEFEREMEDNFLVQKYGLLFPLGYGIVSALLFFVALSVSI